MECTIRHSVQRKFKLSWGLKNWFDRVLQHNFFRAPFLKRTLPLSSCMAMLLKIRIGGAFYCVNKINVQKIIKKKFWHSIPTVWMVLVLRVHNISAVTSKIRLIVVINGTVQKWIISGHRSKTHQKKTNVLMNFYLHPNIWRDW